jgi:hypothetical protein
MAYVQDRDAAIPAVKALALRIIADEIEHDERAPDTADIALELAARESGARSKPAACLPLLNASAGASGAGRARIAG